MNRRKEMPWKALLGMSLLALSGPTLALAQTQVSSVVSGGQGSQGLPADTTQASRIVSTHRLTFPEGDEFFRLIERKRTFEGRSWREVSVQFEERRTAAPDTEREVLLGKDTDGDGFYDAWFFSDDEHLIQSHDEVASAADGWDVASVLIRDRIRPKDRAYTKFFFDKVFMGLSIAGSAEARNLAKIEAAQYFLAELELRTERLRRADPDSADLPQLYSTIADNWAEISQEIGKSPYRRQWLRIGGDVALYYTGAGPLFKWLGRGLEWFGGRVGESIIGQALDRAYVKYLAAINRRAFTAAGRVFAPVGRVARRVHGPIRILGMGVATKTNSSLLFLDAQGQAGKIAATALRALGGAGKAGVLQIPYITGASAIQLVAEVNSRHLWSPDPLVMSHQVLNNKDLMYNLKYMTAETFMLAGATTYLGTGWKSMRICAVISMLNSTTMNIFVKGEADPLRVAFDTSWEVSIGNLQTQLDMRVGAQFNRLAAATGQRRYAIVGFALAMADQYAGYRGLVPASDWVESGRARELLGNAEKAVKSKLGIAEKAYLDWVGRNGGKEADGTEPLKSPRLVLVPLVAPQL